MNDDYLDKLHKEMRAVALSKPRTSTYSSTDEYRRRTPTGLGIVLYVTIGQVWKLSLYRTGNYPSPSEIRAVKKSFGVPSDAKESKTVVDEWRIVRLQWPEITQGKLFEIVPKETTNYEY